MIKLTQEEKKYLLDSIRIISDFPKKGIIFRDITTLLNNKEALNFLLRHLKERYKDYKSRLHSRNRKQRIYLCIYDLCKT